MPLIMLQVSKMNIRTIITIALLLSALFVFYRVYTYSEPTLSYDEFLTYLSNAQKFYIVMDIRNVDSTVATNIMQCGVDFAGSLGLLGKKMFVYAIDSTSCVSENETSSISSCIPFLNPSDGLVLHINGIEGTYFYQNKALIKIEETYEHECSIFS